MPGSCGRVAGAKVSPASLYGYGAQSGPFGSDVARTALPMT